ncbi:hypothetical protein ACFV1N_41660 [Streptosporangium canum]|uniref:hypothetical protein n=1 Tax=Streptosporangium canum TaxID=324952 RepID=UPI0036C721A5
MPSRDNPAAVLFDRDGTLIVNVPCDRGPGRVEPVPGTRRAPDRTRRAAAFGVDAHTGSRTRPDAGARS